MKFATLFSMVIFQTLVHGAADECTVDRLDPLVAVVHVGSRAITVTGWAHLDDNNTATAKAILRDALEAAQRSDCGRAAEKLAEIRLRLAKPVQLKDLVVKVLEATNSDHALSSVGIELTPKELAESWENLKVNEKKLGQIQAACAEKVSPHLNGIRELIQGPELTFALKHEGPSMLIPLENEQAKAENAKSFDEQVTFNDSDPRIDERSKQALILLWQNVLAQKDSEEATYDRGVSFAPDPAERLQLKEKLKASIAVLKRRMQGAYARNSWIAQNILKAKGNMGVVVGYNHVNDLLKQLLDQCDSKNR